MHLDAPTRIAVYGTHDGFIMNYDQVMAIHTPALASSLNITAAYDYGNDENYLPKQFDGNIATLEERSTAILMAPSVQQIG